MLLAYPELLELKNQDIIRNITEADINSTSIDLTLADTILYEQVDKSHYPSVVFLKNRESLRTGTHNLNMEPFYLYPGQFVLASTRQIFNLPNNISAEYKLKSSMARVGLEHLNAGWCDAGWNGSVLTLELKNMTQDHILVLEKDMPIGQMVFFKHTAVPYENSYAVRGRYNGDKTVMGIKE